MTAAQSGDVSVAIDQSPDFEAIRVYALRRVREQLRAADLAAALVFDPLNIRYVTTTGVAAVWNLHSADRYALVPVESEPVLWEHVDSMPALARRPAAVRWNGDTRHATGWLPFGSGSLSSEHATRFAAEIAGELHERGIAGERIGVDRLNITGTLALQAQGLNLADAQLPFELARSVKSPEELDAMRQSARTCDAAVEEIRRRLRPGVTENELWGAFNGTAFSLGAEYNETRFLVSGPRTNPWMQSASMRVVEDGDLVAFDTDLIGPGGYLTDISRTYLCGAKPPTDEQRRLYGIAFNFVQDALDEFRPGAAFDDLGERLGRRLPQEFQELRYPLVAHGVGLADEYPAIVYADHHPGIVEENMVLSVEAYVGAMNSREGVKFEEQIVVTAAGYEKLSTAPYDERLGP